MLTEGHVFLLVPLASAASRGSNDSIDKVFDDGNDAEPEHPTKRDDDVLVETIAKDVSEVVVEKTKKSKRKRKAIEDASGSTLPPKKLKEDYYAATSNIDVKSLVAICGLILEGSSVPSEVTEPRVVASVTPTPDHGEDGPTYFMSGLNLRTHPLAMKCVVSLDDSHHLGSRFEVNSFARSPVADAPIMIVVVTTTIAADVFVVPVSMGRVESRNLENFKDSMSAGRANANVSSSSKLNKPATSSNYFYALQDLDFEILHHIYVPKWKVTNDSILDDLYILNLMLGQHDKYALGAEVRMRTEHTLEQKDKLEDKCAEQAALLSEKDVEIADLKSLLSLKEAEVAEAIRLHGQLSIVEAADAIKGLKEKNLAIEEEKNVLSVKVTTLKFVTAAKEIELVSFFAQVAKHTSNLSSFQLSRDELGSMVASLKSERDSLADQRSLLETAFKLFRGRMEAMQDEHAMVLVHLVAKLDAQLLEMAAHLEEEIYPRFLTTISGRRWILTHGLKLIVLKCLQSFKYLCTLGETIGYAINKGMQDGLKGGIGHGKAGRDLSIIEAYDPSAEAKYVDALNALRTMDFSLLFVLKSKKDACMANLMDSLRFEGPLAEIPKVEKLQPSLEQLKLAIHMMENDVVLGETSLSFSLQVVHSPSTSATTKPITSLSTTFSSSDVVPPLFVSDYQVSDAKPHDEDPPAITFKEEELGMTPESELASIFCMACFIVLVDEVSWLETYVTDLGIIVFFNIGFALASWIASYSLLSSKRITAFVLYLNENGVSPLLDLIIVRCAHKTCEISSDLDRNLFKLASFPFSLCTSFKHFGDGKLRTTSTYLGKPSIRQHSLCIPETYPLSPKDISMYLRLGAVVSLDGTERGYQGRCLSELSAMKVL
nr:hypothetical protein [Tanacetum cinerariifolium]